MHWFLVFVVMFEALDAFYILNQGLFLEMKFIKFHVTLNYVIMYDKIHYLDTSDLLHIKN